MNKDEEPKKLQTIISVSEYIDNLKKNIIEDLKKEIISWSNLWFKIFAIGFSILFLAGTNALTSSVVRNLMKEDLKRLRDDAINSERNFEKSLIKLKEAIAKAEKATVQAEEYSKNVKGLAEESGNLRKDFEKTTNEYLSSSENFSKELKGLQEEANSFREESKKFYDRAKSERDYVQGKFYQSNSRLEMLDEKINALWDGTKAAISEESGREFEELKKEQEGFMQNSSYNIEIYTYSTNIISYLKLRKNLQILGFIVRSRNTKESTLYSYLKERPKKIDREINRNKVLITYENGDKEKADIVASKLNELLNIEEPQLVPYDSSQKPNTIEIVIPSSTDI